ncbi:hypothetical protein ARZXY2_4422 (plasmid) [Arthrobacter sp. ZXY-2]|nr:hypothetical protein ARZXY2_4422 [Arthrobacter sp. ZXY-2]
MHVPPQLFPVRPRHPRACNSTVAQSVSISDALDSATPSLRNNRAR